MDIRELAVRDPVAAYGIWQGIPRVPFVFNLLGSFSTLSTGKGNPVKVASPVAAIAQRVWIDNISYTVQCPNILPNQVWKPQFDADLKLSPGIQVQIEVLGGPKFLEATDFVDLANLANLIRADRWPAGWPLFKQQIVQGTFVLTQPPGGKPSNQGPYNFALTFNGWQFLSMFADEIDPLRASKVLQQAGILESCVVEARELALVEVAREIP